MLFIFFLLYCTNGMNAGLVTSVSFSRPTVRKTMADMLQSSSVYNLFLTFHCNYKLHGKKPCYILQFRMIIRCHCFDDRFYTV